MLSSWRFLVVALISSSLLFTGCAETKPEASSDSDKREKLVEATKETDIASDDEAQAAVDALGNSDLEPADLPEGWSEYTDGVWNNADGSSVTVIRQETPADGDVSAEDIIDLALEQMGDVEGVEVQELDRGRIELWGVEGAGVEYSLTTKDGPMRIVQYVFSETESVLVITGTTREELAADQMPTVVDIMQSLS